MRFQKGDVICYQRDPKYYVGDMPNGYSGLRVGIVESCSEGSVNAFFVYEEDYLRGERSTQVKTLFLGSRIDARLYEESTGYDPTQMGDREDDL